MRWDFSDHDSYDETEPSFDIHDFKRWLGKQNNPVTESFQQPATSDIPDLKEEFKKRVRDRVNKTVDKKLRDRKNKRSS